MTTLLMAAMVLLLQEPRTADEVIGKVKDVFGKASSIAIESTIEYREDEAREGPKRETFTARFLATSENKARCEHVYPPDGGDRNEPLVILNGDRVGFRKSVKDPFEIYKASLKIYPEMTEAIFHLGLYGMPIDIPSSAKRAADGVAESPLAKVRSRFVLSKYELREPERKDGRECAVVACSMTPKGEDKPIASIRMWIDKSTWLPVGREMHFDSGKKGTIVETYSSIQLNSKIDPAQFDLPEVKK